jgi:mono/diheme cytochrome c family protein
VKTGFVLSSAVALLASASFVSAQNPTNQGHPEDYPRVDIEHGARLYPEHCDRCHGANGDGVGGVNLRSGKFRNATTDQQLRTLISNGFPTRACPPSRSIRRISPGLSRIFGT